MRYLIAIIIFLTTAVTASAMTDIVGYMGKSTGFSGRFPIVGGIGTGTPPPTGDILLVDGSSFLLQVDNSSLVCRAGGC